MQTPLKCVIVAVVTAAFYAGLAACAAFAFTGGGEGSDYFARIVLSPFGFSERYGLLGLVLWPVIGGLLALRKYPLSRFIAAAVLLAHYVGVGLVSARTHWYFVARVWRAVPALVLLFLVLYLASHAVFWVMIAERQKSPGLNTPT